MNYAAERGRGAGRKRTHAYGVHPLSSAVLLRDERAIQYSTQHIRVKPVFRHVGRCVRFFEKRQGVLAMTCKTKRGAFQGFAAAQKLHRHRQREGGAASNENDNFLITVRLSDSFPLLFTVWFAATKEADFIEQTERGISENARMAAGRADTPLATILEPARPSSKTSSARRRPR